MKIRIDKLDQLFSKFIRLRAKNKCQRCGAYKEVKQLQCAHCFGRRKQSVRYDEDNALGLDFMCHRLIDEDPEEKRRVFIKHLGEEGYKKLMIRAEIPNRPDRIAIEMYLKPKIKELEDGFSGQD